jgi:hypothetical protein
MPSVAYLLVGLTLPERWKLKDLRRKPTIKLGCRKLAPYQNENLLTSVRRKTKETNKTLETGC